MTSGRAMIRESFLVNDLEIPNKSLRGGAFSPAMVLESLQQIIAQADIDGAV
jgi:hypothetical protein